MGLVAVSYCFFYPMYGQHVMTESLLDLSPVEAWAALKANPDAQLVDVRTQPEWVFAGTPDLAALDKQTLTISWKLYPTFETNPQFLVQLENAAPDVSMPLYFICKTGGRSTDAAMAAIAAGYAHCFNIAGGFEGDLNAENQRGKINGWKASQLPWSQA